MMIPPARLAAVHALLAERERQDSLHGFNPARPTGFGGWWWRWLDALAHHLYARAKRRGTVTWAHVLVEEVLEVLSSRAPSAAVKECRQVAAVCVKVEEALVASGQVPAGTPRLEVDDAPWTPRSGTLGPATQRLLARMEWNTPSAPAPALAAFHAYSARFPRESRTAADCQALLGAYELALSMGADPEALAKAVDPAELGATLARLTRATPAGGVQ